jgi:hypothetical protein
LQNFSFAKATLDVLKPAVYRWFDFSGKNNQFLPCFFKISNFEKTTLDVLGRNGLPFLPFFVTKLTKFRYKKT